MNLPDGLLEAARDRAREEGRTVTSLMEEALWNLLARHEPRPAAVALPTDGQPEGRFLIDIDDKNVLWSVLDADELR